VVFAGGELPIGLVLAGPAWTPTAPLPLTANLLAVLGEQQVAFRFAAAGGEWSIDDVYVDPYRKG
jgi:hypothetical protein